MDLAVVAAFTAAGLSLVGVGVNVLWSYRLSRHAQLEQWRQNEERPIVARMLTLSADALEKWQQAGQARRDWLDSLRADPTRGHEDTKARDEATNHWGAGSGMYEKLRFEAAQLDLIAGHPLREVANKLVREHESVQRWLRPASGANDWFELLTEQNNKIIRLHAELVEKTRADLGVDRGAGRSRKT